MKTPLFLRKGRNYILVIIFELIIIVLLLIRLAEWTRYGRAKEAIEKIQMKEYRNTQIENKKIKDTIGLYFSIIDRSYEGIEEIKKEDELMNYIRKHKMSLSKEEIYQNRYLMKKCDMGLLKETAILYTERNRVFRIKKTGEIDSELLLKLLKKGK